MDALFAGNTVEGERREGSVPGIDTPNKVEGYATGFVAYFDNDETVKKKANDKIKKGVWRVTGEGDLCMKWGEKKERCVPVYKDGKEYKRVVKR